MQSTTAVSIQCVPVSQAKAGERGTVVRISGDQGTKKFLSELGFTAGTEIRLVSDVKGNKILNIRGSKIAVDSRMASKIMYCPE